MRHAKIIATLIFALALICCDNDSIKGCGLDNPIQELDWLRTQIDSMESNPTNDTKYCYVVQGTYKRRTVFQVQDCNPVINKVVFTLNCDGNRIDSNDDIVFQDDIKKKTIIWKPIDFACQVDF